MLKWKEDQGSFSPVPSFPYIAKWVKNIDASDIQLLFLKNLCALPYMILVSP